jgi:hypothetical protein
MYNLFTKYLLYTNTYFVCIIYLFLMTFYVLVFKITNSVMLNFLCPTTIQTLIIFYIFSRRTNSGILSSARNPHVFQLSSHLPGVVTFAYDLRFRRVIARWKGIVEEIHFGGSIMPLDYH